LGPDDVSLTFDAASRVVTRHAGGRAEVVGDDVFAALECELASGSPRDRWFGYFGYACRPDLPAATIPTGRPARVPDAVWMRPSQLRSFHHPDPPGGIGRGATARTAGPRQPAPGAVPIPADYAAAFDRVQERLHAGDSYEVNLTYRHSRHRDVDPVAAYRALRRLSPAPYAGYLQHDVPGHRAWLLSSSPERYAAVSADRHLETRPIKGTTPRGGTRAEDRRQRRLLATAPRFRSENLMIVDLLRNDLATVCEPGTVAVPRLMQVESYPGVHQLVSTVRGRLRPEVSTVQALRALFPAGSMTGAPKLRTMAIIDDVESTPRGVYAGAFGWLAADGRADLGVVIRSLVSGGDGRWELGTGGGVTVHSDAAGEYLESLWKAERLLRALTDPHGAEPSPMRSGSEIDDLRA
jgi:para-aminobenzoate synthetase